MFKFKKVFCLLLCIILVSSIVSCGKDKGQGEDSESYTEIKFDPIEGNKVEDKYLIRNYKI